jgi:hypothetical protein
MTACHGLLQIQRDQARAVVRHGQQWIGLGFGWPKRAPIEANRYFARLAHFGRQVVRHQNLVQGHRIATAQAILAGQRRQFIARYGLRLGTFAQGLHVLDLPCEFRTN